MPEMIRLRVDGQEVEVPAGSTLLEAAQAAGRSVPTLCYHEALTPPGLCRLCVVEVAGERRLQAACVTEARAGQEVATDSPRVQRARRTTVAMLASATDVSEAPVVQELLQRYAVDPATLGPVARREYPLLDDNPMYIRDYSQCVLCWRCVQACAADAQYVFALTFAGRGFHTRISTAYDIAMPDSPCVFCGQCVAVCPTGALKPRRAYLLEHGYTPEELAHYAAVDDSPLHRPPTAYMA